MQNIFSCLKQNKTPTVLGLLRYLNQRYKNYFPKSDIEEFEKKHGLNGMVLLIIWQ